ncbi:MAG: LacI family transcriptional regulator [Treponema sp.]|jgi:DNA-binding LacI/PurR family transcriptional regulator|nr:LacI family transcriptional regulator [Treponema sp.]
MKHITIADIAKEAGVSKATVSRVLSKPYLVNEKTQEKIRSVIDKYSFIPSILAQGLAGMPTKNIGVLVDRFPNNFYIELADGIDSVISANNYFFQVMNSLWIPERELQGIRSMIKNRVDGILIAPISPDSPAVELLKKSDMPFVLMNCKSNDPNVSYVCTDNYMGGSLMAEHFNSLDHEQIIVVSVFDHQSVQDRIKGFLDHLYSETVRIIRYSDAKTYEHGYELASLIVEHDSIRTKKTSLFVANDYVAVGVIARLLEMNIVIPGQVAVAGFDDIRVSALCKVPLTTVSQSVYDMGRTAAEDLLSIIQKTGRPPFKRIIKPRMVIRESTVLSMTL